MHALVQQLRTMGHTLPDPLLVRAVRAAIDDGDHTSASAYARTIERELLTRVINATGVLLHTNLGRAPVDVDAMRHDYTNLELDLASGVRGARAPGVAGLLGLLTGAEDAFVANNGAAAVLLALAAIADGATVVVSRGQVIEIGGGFRIPDILALSGARLVEVGTTNITRLSDYRDACTVADPAAGAILVVHRSNFSQTGFVRDVAPEDLVGLGLPVVVDAGSGLLDASTPWLPDGPPSWLGAEPAVRQLLAGGAALVTFSGDKLLGGPQAGVIAGRRDLVERCRAHPLARAVRPGRLVLAALQATLLAYLRRDLGSLPVWRMAATPREELRRRATQIAPSASAQVVECESVVGGGAAPGARIPSAGLSLRGDVTRELRDFDPPVIARVVEGMTVCDLRTVDPADDAILTDALIKAHRA